MQGPMVQGWGGGTVQLVPEDTQFTPHLKAQEATEQARGGGTQLLTSC